MSKSSSTIVYPLIRYVLSNSLKKVTEHLRILPDDVDYFDEVSKHTPLSAAVSIKSLDMIKLLAENKANINAFNPDTRSTPLMYAAELNHTEIVKYLISKGCKINGTIIDNPIGYAAEKGNREMIELLLESGANINSMCGSNGYSLLTLNILHDEGKLAEYLIEKGIDVNSVDVKGCNSFIYAASKLNERVIKLLKDKGADIHKVDHRGFNALRYLFASLITNESKKKEVLRLSKVLIDMGIDINGYDINHRDSLLFFAIERKDNLPLVKYLISKGADVNHCNFFNMTPLMFAAEGSSFDYIKLLLINGANPNIKDKCGNTVLDYAIKRNHADIIRILKAAMSEKVVKPEPVKREIVYDEVVDSDDEEEVSPIEVEVPKMEVSPIDGEVILPAVEIVNDVTHRDPWGFTL